MCYASISLLVACSFGLICFRIRAGFPPITTSSGHVPLTFVNVLQEKPCLQINMKTYHYWACSNYYAYVHPLLRSEKARLSKGQLRTVPNRARSNYCSISTYPNLHNNLISEIYYTSKMKGTNVITQLLMFHENWESQDKQEEKAHARLYQDTMQVLSIVQCDLSNDPPRRAKFALGFCNEDCMVLSYWNTWTKHSIIAYSNFPRIFRLMLLSLWTLWKDVPTQNLTRRKEA